VSASFHVPVIVVNTCQQGNSWTWGVAQD